MDWRCRIFGHKWKSIYYSLTGKLGREIKCKRCGKIMPQDYGQEKL